MCLSEPRHIFHDEELRLNLSHQPKKMAEELTPHIVYVPATYVTEALAGRAADDSIDLASGRFFQLDTGEGGNIFEMEFCFRKVLSERRCEDWVEVVGSGRLKASLVRTA